MWRALAVLLFLAGSLVPSGEASAATYRVDQEHTSVTFRIRHLFTQVTGRFDKFGGTIRFDPAKPKETSVEGWIDAASINTNQAKRDEHLRSKDFFDVKQFPRITFASTGVASLGSDNKSGKLAGELTIRGVTKPVVLDVAFLGEATDPWGNRRAGFTASTTINRRDFGLNWNEVLETGGLLVGDQVHIQIEAEGMIEE